MDRRNFIKKIGLASASLAIGGHLAFAKKEDRPNILWIVSEDNSPLLGCYGDKFATTPNLDKLAGEGILYENAFANAPVCAPTRCTIITGMYPPALGTEHMRSKYPVPNFVKFFPKYLMQAGYYCTNNSKTDYNTVFDTKDFWDISSRKAHYKNRKDTEPFFSVFNISTSHESSIHRKKKNLDHDPEKVTLPPYHPDTPEIRHDLAHYYDNVQQMDEKVGEYLKELKRQGLDKDTIVFYYADHGGVLTRSKRYLFDSGVHVPFIVRFPKKYQHLAPARPGTRVDRLISFIDLAPTVLSLAGVKVPGYMPGSAFAGKQKSPDPRYVHLFRGRMDERYDMMRALRDKRFKYIRNYMPHRIYGQHLNYLWRQATSSSWQKAYKQGKCNQAQSAFWEPKPAEELYDIKADPYEVNNLANDPKYKPKLLEMRNEIKSWVRKNRDTGFVPETMLVEMTKERCAYDVVKDPNFPIEKIIETAETATQRDASKLGEIIEKLSDDQPGIVYWAAVGCAVLGDKAKPATDKLIENLSHRYSSVRIASAEALCKLDRSDVAVPVLIKELDNENSMAVVHALDVLDTVGDKAKPAFEKIKHLANNSKHRYIKDAAGYLFKKLF